MSTIGGRVQSVAKRMVPLGVLLREEILNGGYIQADETRIPVRDRAKSKGMSSEGQASSGLLLGVFGSRESVNHV